MKNKCMLVVILLILSGTAFAKIVLPPIFSDNKPMLPFGVKRSL